MPSRQDQLHSYQFMVQRVVSALVLRETDPVQSPFRRAAGTALASVLIAAIALGAVVVYGVFAGGGATSWRDARAVIVEKESGARYVYRDGRLHLVLNYASALLIVGGSEQRTVLVSRSSLAGVARGAPLGIPDAPDSLPAPGQLSRAPWTVCSMAPVAGDTRSGPRSALLVGQPVGGGRGLADDAVLGRHPDGSLHLLWHNRRHLLRDADLVLAALSWTSERPVPLAPALLNTLPAGADLGRLIIGGQGRRSVRVPDARIGEVFVVTGQGGARQYAVAARDGLAGITEVQADLLLTGGTGQDRPTPMTQSRFAALPKLPDLVPVDSAAPPATRPRLVPAGAALCAPIDDEGGVREVRVDADAPDVAGAAPTGGASSRDAVLVDHVLVPPGRGAVVEAAAAPGAPGGAVCVVTDLGRRYAVTDPAVLGMLGYGDVQPLRLPAAVVALVPAGRVLDPTVAREPAVPA